MKKIIAEISMIVTENTKDRTLNLEISQQGKLEDFATMGSLLRESLENNISTKMAVTLLSTISEYAKLGVQK